MRRHTTICTLFVSILLAGCVTRPVSWTPASAAPPPWNVEETGAESGGGVAALQTPPTSSGGDASAPEAPARPLTLADAVVIAFENNLSIAVADLDPAIASTTVQEARADFDPSLSASLRYERDTSRTTSAITPISTAGLAASEALADIAGAVQSIQALAGAAGATETTTARTNRTTSGAALSQYFPTGATLTVSADYAGANQDASDDAYSGGWGVELRQALLRGAGRGVNLISVRQAENDVAIGGHALRQQVLSTVIAVEQAYWELALAQELRKISDVAVTLAGEQMRLNQDLLDAGRGVEADVLSAKAERATRLADRTDAQARIEDANLALIRLLNPQSPGRWSIRFDPMTDPEPPIRAVDTAESVARAMAYRPEIAQARLALANAEMDTHQARNNALPRLDLVASVSGGSEGDHASDAWGFSSRGDSESWGIGLELNTALYRRAEKARLLSGRLRETQRERQLADTEQGVESEVRRAVVELNRLQDRIAATQEAVVARASELDTAESRYKSGRSTNLDVLQVQRDYIQAQIDAVEAKIGSMQALAALYAAEGTLPERRGIAVQPSEASGGF